MRSLPIALAATIAVGAAAPSAASAAKGWKLPTIHSNLNGLQVTVRASHCGKSKFGTWTFRQRAAAEGTVARVRMRLKVTKDGKLHRGTGVRVTGSAPQSAKDTIRTTLRSQRTHYVAGSPPKLETLAADDTPISHRAFKPKRTTRC